MLDVERCARRFCRQVDKWQMKNTKKENVDIEERDGHQQDSVCWFVSFLYHFGSVCSLVKSSQRAHASRDTKKKNTRNERERQRATDKKPVSALIISLLFFLYQFILPPLYSSMLV